MQASNTQRSQQRWSPQAMEPAPTSSSSIPGQNGSAYYTTSQTAGPSSRPSISSSRAPSATSLIKKKDVGYKNSYASSQANIDTNIEPIIYNRKERYAPFDCYQTTARDSYAMVEKECYRNAGIRCICSTWLRVQHCL